MTDAATALYGGSAAPVAPAASVPTPGASLAERMYGTPTPATPPPASPAQEPTPTPHAPIQAEPATVEKAGPTLAPIPESIKAMREADSARKLFDNSADLERAGISADQFPELPPDFAKALAGELREMARDAGFNANDVTNLRAALRRAADTPMTDARRAEAHDLVKQTLNERYGMDAKQALRDAQAFVASDPRRAKLLAKVGDDPAIVLRIVELAREAKTRRT